MAGTQLLCMNYELNKVIQIDESKFGKRQFNRGRHIEGHWVICMIEDGNANLRPKVYPDNGRSADILVPLIKKTCPGRLHHSH
ncbi:unnamed protein product [Pieris brassicae]|uniref:ISXO2-like transposase domain-containing protein n=1 Tax=Pieris brassicae TaxID=7116 RepID=A0A9P0SVV2_PIEBR|nr:unnamed protein product [Pieris brassicae]